MPSQRFLDALGPAGAPQWVTTIDWSNDGGNHWEPCEFRRGQAECSQTQQWRWSSSITVAEAPYGRNGINPFQTRYRIRRGMRHAPWETPELVGLGVYSAITVNRSTETQGEIEISGRSFEHYLIESRIYRPRTIRANSARVVAEQLIREVLPNAVIDWDPTLDQYMLLPQLVSIEDRWNTLAGDRDARSIMQALAARLYTEGDGTWLVRPVRTLQDPALWTVTNGVDGVQLSAEEGLTSEGVYNVEVVTGTPGGGSVIGPGIARDTDESSLTYVGRTPDEGGFGERAAPEYQSQMVTSLAQANQVARSRLASKLGLRRSLSFGMLHNPLMRAGDVGLVRSPDGRLDKVILDSVPFDLSSTPGPMVCQTRTTQTRLAGDVTDLPSETGEDGDDG
jgi:hypothetical protein